MTGRTARRVLRHPQGVAAAALILGLLLLGLAAPAIASRGPDVQEFSSRLLPPSAGHLFGTDGFGRDVFTRWLWGLRLSLGIGLGAVAGATLVGAAVGLCSGYVSGRLDLAVQRVVDALMGFPFLVLAVVLLAARGGSPENVAMALGLGFFPVVSRLARAQVVALRAETWVIAARAAGASGARIAFRHILPHLLPLVLVLGTGLAGSAVVAEATLSFLGLGVPPPHPAVGNILSDGARRYLEAAPWIVLCPTAGLMVLAGSLHVLGDAMRDWLDPRG